MSTTLKRTTTKKNLVFLKSLNQSFLFISLILVYVFYDSCVIHECESRSPAFSELKKVTGTYVALQRYKGTDSGGLSQAGKAGVAWCGTLAEDLVGMPAIGWFDSEGNIYQLQVGSRSVCDYKTVLEAKAGRKTSAPIYFYASIFIFLVLCVFEVILLVLLKRNNLED